MPATSSVLATRSWQSMRSARMLASSPWARCPAEGDFFAPADLAVVRQIDYKPASSGERLRAKFEVFMKLRFWQMAILGTACGCSMCQDPFDYSRPVQGSPPMPYSHTTTRAGSISATGSMAAPASSAPQVPQPATSPVLEPKGPSGDNITRQPAPSTMRR